MSQFATIAVRLLFAGFCLVACAHSIQAEPLGSRPYAWERYAAVAPANPDNLPVIAIVIDDVGLNTRRAQAALALPAPMTIAILPYSQNAAQLARDARALGHEVLLHLPMQAVGGENPGPEALLSSLGKEEFDRRLIWNLAQLDGYVGVSNHMGSLLTQDRVAMTSLFSVLRQRGLMFLDSKTAPRSVGASISRSMGLPTLTRDIFLDNVITPEHIRAQLQRLESTARRDGVAIAIGHPHDATVAELNAWALAVEARGFKLAPLTALLDAERTLRSAALGKLD